MGLLPKFGQKWILVKKPLSFYKYSNYLSSHKKSEKTKDAELTYEQTGNSDFVGLSIGQGPVKLE